MNIPQVSPTGLSGQAWVSGNDTPRVHYLQHVPFEGLGRIESWLFAHNVQVSSSRLFEDFSFPRQDVFDGLIILGGPMSVNDTDVHPWLDEEIRFIAATVAAGKPVLGICLGAQLIARALGSEVYPILHKEIGWHALQVTEAKLAAIWGFSEQTPVFQWHGESFDLPEGAIRLASSQACRNQAFLVGDRVLGLQFHPEITPEGTLALISHCGNDLSPGEFVQPPEAILGNEAGLAQGQRTIYKILSRLFLSRSQARSV